MINNIEFIFMEKAYYTSFITNRMWALEADIWIWDEPHPNFVSMSKLLISWYLSFITCKMEIVRVVLAFYSSVQIKFNHKQKD